MKNIEQDIKEDIKSIDAKCDIQKKIEICQSQILADPSNAKLHIRLGDLYLEWHLDLFQARSYIDEAISEYQCALESCIDSAEIYFKLGMAFYHKRDLDKAISYFNMALEKDASMAQTYMMIADCMIRKTHFQDAEEYAQKAINVSPFTASWAYFLLYSLSRIKNKNRLSGCLGRVKNLILGFFTIPFDKMMRKKVARHCTYLLFLPMLIKGAIAANTNGYEKALEIYQQAIEKAPNFVLLYCLTGEIYRILGRYEDAICEYKMAIWLDSMNIPAYESLCQAYEEQGDFDNAVLTYQKLIEMQPYVASYHGNLANILYLKGDVKEAVSHYQNAITINPNPTWTSIIAQTLGYVLQENQQSDSAISAYQSAYLLTPQNIEIYVNMGSAFFDKEDYDGALTIYRKALELEPHNAKIHCNLGYLYWNKENIQEAINEYELAIKYDPDYDIAYNNLGVIYLDDLARIQSASEMFEQAVRCNPNYVLAYYNLARAVTIKGDKVEAAKLYQIANDINNVTHEMEESDISEKIKELFD